MSNDSREIKVTDKRMFTPDGKLREEYSFLEEASTAAAAADAPAATSSAPAASSTPSTPQEAARGAAATSPPAERSRHETARSRREPARPGEPDRADLDRAADWPEPADSGGRVEIPGTPPGLGPTFYDLVAMLAEPVSIYLGDLELPDGGTAENLEMARLHIDLLDVLRQKTAGNLTAQESAFMEDLLYRLRVRYVQKRG